MEVNSNFLERISVLDELGIDKDDFAIFGSGPMAVRGIRDSDDIDIIVRKDVWEKFLEKHEEFRDGLIRIGDIDICGHWMGMFSEVESLIDDAEIIGGYRFVKLKYVLEYKNNYAREKDLLDIKLIEKYLERD